MSKKHNEWKTASRKRAVAALSMGSDAGSSKKLAQEKQNVTPLRGVLLRLYWMLIGNALMMFCFLGIAHSGSNLLSVLDIFYWIITGSLIVSRYVDIRHYGGTTGDGEPATMSHWRRYTATVGALAVVLWIGAHAIAYFQLL